MQAKERLLLCALCLRPGAMREARVQFHGLFQPAEDHATAEREGVLYTIPDLHLGEWGWCRAVPLGEQ